MKSTKSIFVVALAALMLVAFTACQPGNTTINNVNGTPISATVTSQDTIYAGTMDDAKAVVTVLYDNGTIVDNVNVVIETTSAFVPGEQSGKVEIPVKDQTEKTVEVPVVYNVTAATSIVVEYTEPAAAIESKDDLVFSGLYAVYPDEHREKVNGGFKYVDDRENSAILFTLPATADYSTEDLTFSVPVEFTATEAPEISKLTATYDDGKKPIVGQKFDSSLVKVVAEYSDDTEKTLVLGTDYYLSNYEHTFVTADITTAVKFKVTLYESAQAGDTHKDCTLSINAVADYVTGFTATQKTSGDPATPTTVYTRGETEVNVSQFDFKVTSYKVAKVETGVNDTITTGVTIFDTPTTVPAGYPSNTLRVWFRVGEGDTAVTTYCDVPVVDPVDGDSGDAGIGG